MTPSEIRFKLLDKLPMLASINSRKIASTQFYSACTTCYDFKGSTRYYLYVEAFVSVYKDINAFYFDLERIELFTETGNPVYIFNITKKDVIDKITSPYIKQGLVSTRESHNCPTTVVGLLS